MRDSAWSRAARGDVVLFTGCVLLSLLALALPASWAAGVTRALRSSILRPIVMLQARATSDRMARFQLPAITAQRDSLGQVAHDAGAVLQENTNLRNLLELRPRISLHYISAEVLHQGANTDSRMLLIGVGTAEGVAQFDPVVTADGLVGMVWVADVHSSSVITWLHPEFRAHAVTAGGTASGMISPTQGASTQTLLELSGVALKDTLDIGAVAYTSSLGGVYPRGIRIGTIISVQRDSLNYDRVYRLAPFVNPGSTTQVLVLKAERGAEFLPVPSTVKKP